MYALSVRQPYASLIAHGAKTIETRSWATAHRGKLMIHASKKVWMPDAAYLKSLPLSEAEELLSQAQALPLGQAIAICDIVDCRPMTVADENDAHCAFFQNAFSWVLANIRPIDPFPVSGKQRLFTVPFPTMS